MGGKIEIGTAKWKGYIVLTISVLWMSLFVLALIDPEEAQFEKIEFLLMGMPLLGIIYSIYLLRFRKPVITIDNTNLILNLGKTITIPLNQIAKVRLPRRRLNLLLAFMRDIEITWRDRDAVLPPLTKMQKRLLKVAQGMADYHVLIPVFGLEQKPKEIYELIRNRAGLPIEPS